MSEEAQIPLKKRWQFRLLVALGLIGSVIGLCSVLLIPAVLRVKDAADRMTTTGTMKQLGLAIHNYHDAMGGMPGPFLDGDLVAHGIPDDPTRRMS